MRRKYLFPAFLVIIVIPTISVEGIARSPDLVKGVIVDGQDARVRDARILIEGKNLRRELTSNEVGEFETELPKGRYRIQVTHAIFKTRVIKNLKVPGSEQSTLSIKLEVKRALASGGKCSKGGLCL